MKLPIEQYLNNTNEKTEIIQPKLNFFSTHSESKEQIINPKEGQIFFKFYYIKFNCKATKINIEKDKIALTKPEISSYNKELIKRAKEIIKNKSDIKLIDNQIKQEEFEKQKELFSLQSKLTSKIIENSKIAASANLPSNLPKNQTSLELKPQVTISIPYFN